MKKIIIIVLIAVVLIVAGAGWFAWRSQIIKNAPKCGGFAGLSCPIGYTCEMGEYKHPDQMGFCRKMNSEEIKKYEEGSKQKSIDTTNSNLNIYTNEQYRFSVGYPSDWKIWHSNEVGATFVDPNNDKSFINVAVYKNDPLNMFRGTDQISSEESFELNGVIGKKLNGESARSGENATFVIFLKNDNYYTLTTSAYIFDETIQTFKFIQDVANSWKTYINSRVGYQFEYPNSNLSLEINETIKYPNSQTKNQDLVQFVTDSKDASEQQPVSYGVRTYVGVKNSSIENWIQSGGSSTNQDLSNYIKRSIDGQTAYIGRSIAITYVMYKNNVYIIEAHSGIEPARDTDPIYNHILSSFKFVQ